MEVLHINEENKGYFKIIDKEKEAGRITYSWAGTDKFIIDHTEVDEAYKGKSLGKKMLIAAVAYAREKEAKILPLCPFAKTMFDRMDEIKDVLF